MINPGPCCECKRRTIALRQRTKGLRHRLALTGLQLGYLKGSDDSIICESCVACWIPNSVQPGRNA